MTAFLVTGVTGNLGSAALGALLTHVAPSDVRVLVRTERAASRFAHHGLRACVADYSDPASVDAALTGVDRAIFVSSPVLDPGIRAEQHRAVVESAVAAGVKHLVYTSGMGARHDPGHAAAEDALVASGIQHVILRNALYTDAFVRQAISQTSASGGQSLSTAAIGDLGEAAATAAIQMPKKSLWELRGPQWNFDELAAALTVALRSPVAQEEVTDDETGPFAALFPLVRRGVFSAETPDLAELLGHAPANIGDVVTRLVNESDERQPASEGPQQAQ